MDEGFRSLTAKEIRKQNERRMEDSQKEKKRRPGSHGDGCNIGDELDGSFGRKRREDEKSSEERRRERSRERHSTGRLGDELRSDGGRLDVFGTRKGSSELRHSRDRSLERYSSRAKEDRTDHRSHHQKQSDSKQCRKNDRRPIERSRDSRRNRSRRHRSPEDNEEGSKDRPAWATKAVMKRAEEIQKRKLIWSKPEEKKESDINKPTSPVGPRASTTATWNSILAASSSDSKQLDKFKRLMGMKKSDEEGQNEKSNIDDGQIEAERKRQRELYSQLDQQYAVARSVTHLSRGQGLGFHQ